MAELLTRRALRQGRRAFWQYWAATTISTSGTAITTVALPLVAVSTLHATVRQISFLTAASWIAWLLIGLPAGAVVSRWPLRATQISMDLLRAGALLSVPLAAGTGVLTFAQLLVVALTLSFCSVVYSVANSAFLPAIVPRHELMRRNSLLSGSESTTQLVGPSVGGVLVQLIGATSSLALDAASYLLAAAFMQRISRTGQPKLATTYGQSTFSRIAAGLRFVHGHVIMRHCVLAAAIINFCCGALLTLTPVYLVRDLHAPPAVVGLVLAGEGLGSLLGASLTTRLVRRMGSSKALSTGAGVAVAGFALLPLGGSGVAVPLFALGNVVFAGGTVVFAIVARTHRQTVTPADYLSRVMATVRFVSWGAIPVGSLAAGTLADEVGLRGTLACVAVLLVVAIPVVRSAAIRRTYDLIDYETAPAHP